jgi:hypothetical protein
VHVSAHVACEHTSPSPQTTAHEPQFVGSDVMSTHAAPHAERPAGQEHAPSVHTLPPSQTMPQRPQCLASVRKLTQAPSQDACPVPHPGSPPEPPLLLPSSTQISLRQTRPLSHSCPERHWQRSAPRRQPSSSPAALLPEQFASSPAPSKIRPRIKQFRIVIGPTPKGTNSSTSTSSGGPGTALGRDLCC